MILTVTMNASLDKTYRVARLDTGTVMRVREVSDTAGGKGLNVARVAALLGEEVRATGFLGGFNGGRIRTLLFGSGVEDSFVDTGVETRACINVMDDATGESTEFLEPGVPVESGQYAAFIDRYVELVAASDAVTISGSLPKGAPDGFYARLITLAREAGKPVVLDASGQLLREGVAALPTLVKPNRDEIRDLLQETEPLDTDGLVAAIHRLLESGLPCVAVSLGAEGCLFGCQEGVFRGVVPNVQAVNPVGCGDAMVAAFAVGLAQQMPPLETLRLALAVSAASAQCPKTGGFQQEDLANLLPLVRVDKAG